MTIQKKIFREHLEVTKSYINKKACDVMFGEVK